MTSDPKCYEPFWGEWYIDRLIGSGSTSNVYQISNRKKSISALKHIHIQCPNAIDKKDCAEYIDHVVKETSKKFNLARNLPDHPNIIKYHEISIRMADNYADIFIRMDLATPLLQYIESTGMNEENIVRLGVDICNALICCHRHELVHRDIKPTNIFFKNGTFKLGDFGTAITVEEKNGEVIGSLNTIAPEVYFNRVIDFRSDIYSLGITLYWLLNNRQLPFVTGNHQDSSSIMKAVSKRLQGDKLRPPACASKKISNVVLQACAYDIEKRTQSAEQLLINLKEIKTSKKKEIIKPEKRSIDTSDTSQKNDIEDHTISMINRTVHIDASFPVDKTIIEPSSFLNKNPPNNDGRGNESEKSGPAKKESNKKRSSNNNLISWVFFTLGVSSIPVALYILCDTVITNAELGSIVYFHEIIFLSIVLLADSFKDLYLDKLRMKNQGKTNGILVAIGVVFVFLTMVFVLIVVSEVEPTHLALKMKPLLIISISAFLGSFAMGGIVHYLEDHI